MNNSKNSVFDNNLLLLSRNNYQLALVLEKIDTPSSVKISQSVSGLPTAEIRVSPDCTKLIHSAIDPLQDAREWAEMQNISADIFVLLGMGLGYPALALLDTGFPGKLLIAEKDTGILKLALMHCDLTGIFKNENVSLFIGDEVNNLLPHLQNEKIDALSYGSYQPAVSLHPEFYEEIRLGMDKIIFEQHKMHDLQTCLVLEEALKEMMA